MTPDWKEKKPTINNGILPILFVDYQQKKGQNKGATKETKIFPQGLKVS